MKDKIEIIIADDNVEFGSLLNGYFSQQDDMKVVGIARDGLQAIDLIKSLMPDVVILDIIMPNLDGIGVLERMDAMQLDSKPQFIMLSAIGQDIFVQNAISLGAEYYIVKPFDIDLLISRVRQVYNERHFSPFSGNKVCTAYVPDNMVNTVQDNKLDIEVTNLIREAGISPHMLGHRYVREAILQMLCSPSQQSMTAKGIYMHIAEKFDTTDQKVERAIRNAIDSAWMKGSLSAVGFTCSSLNSYNHKKPTNSEFIAFMVKKIKLRAKGK